MSMLDALFNKGFKGAKCKTLLKLTIPRIKLLRNRREIQIKQMRRDIAKLLETGQEATARIRVEHIIREENMMAAQEIIELFCELIAVRLPIVETQRECPLDLKEAISSVCFAAPRCADLPELQQVQMLFASKYGREFISAATELMPDCGVNRQIIELLSIRAPQAEVKLKLLKEIAEEHELDWDPAASETELFKQPEDLLNGPSQFAKPLPKEKHDETVYSATAEASHGESDSDSDLDSLGLPEVPKVSLKPIHGGLASEAIPPQSPIASEYHGEPTIPSKSNEDISHESEVEPEALMPEHIVTSSRGSHDVMVNERNDKQSLPFISPPSLSSASFPVSHSEEKFPASLSEKPNSLSKTKSDLHVDLQDVLAAANAAAESAERAAAAARSAASLAKVRIDQLINYNHENNSERSEYKPNLDESATAGTPLFDHQESFNNTDTISYSLDPQFSHDLNLGPQTPNPTYAKPKMELDSPSPDDQVVKHESTHHQPQRLTSLEDDPYFSYPNLFTAQDPNLVSGVQPVDKAQ
ncbi:Ist1-like protein [Thalictrum thalictroides]|uniref:Ist1-like protein n=1 Tax=Thalictrum thalictroides TaxID=46969 RepID=A0A7J6X3X9_THATH|nr:Ist1-like protein [Thalictrum thalictroides]